MEKTKVTYMDTDSLIPYANNPRLNDNAVDAVAASIKEFGFKVPIVVDGENVIINGHTRLKAAHKLGLKQVPVIVADDLTPEQVKAFRIADNKTSELADWDLQKLEIELDGIDDIDMSEFGFCDGDFGLSLDAGDSKEDDFDVDAALDDASEPKSKLGDVYRLGDHYLMCGDSTNPDDVDKLMGGTVADLYLTDPPYNVAVWQNMGPSKAKRLHHRTDGLVVKNDSWDDDDAFVEFLKQAFGNALEVMKPGAAFYIWYAASQGMNFQRACKECGMQVRQVLVWVKNALSLGRQDYQWRHEPCLYGWKDGAAHNWYSDRKQTTVLEFDKPRVSIEHPTMKPVELFDYQIRNSSKKGDVVLDLFGGSGTTLIACEQSGRKSYMMELDPHYVDVIINRWETFTGGKAVMVNG